MLTLAYLEGNKPMTNFVLMSYTRSELMSLGWALIYVGYWVKIDVLTMSS